jgi:HflC protein
MMREVRDQIRPGCGTSLGLEIEDVRIRRTDLTQEVSQQTFARMRAERLAEAERLRARGNEAAQRIRASADREVVEIVAEARKESEILRGEGEAERNAVFADAFNRDPDFFEFYRSMSPISRRFRAMARRWCCRRNPSSSATSRIRAASLCVRPLRPARGRQARFHLRLRRLLPHLQ